MSSSNFLVILEIFFWYHFAIRHERSTYRSLGWTRQEINLLDLPPEIILMILEKLIGLDPITLLGSIPGVCHWLRALCSKVHGRFDLLKEQDRLSTRDIYGRRKWIGLEGALVSASTRFPVTKGLWTFSVFPLHDACEAGLFIVVEKLLHEDRSRLDEFNICDFTPLQIACEYGHLDVTRLLIDKGADMNQVDNFERTLLTAACLHGHLDVARLLIDNGANVNKADNKGVTPIYVACWHSHMDIAQLLIDNGADINEPVIDGTTPLSMSCYRQNLDVVRFLIDKGVDLNKSVNDGETPLYDACANHHRDVAQLLIESEADLNRTAGYAGTPLSVARKFGHCEIISLLVQAGARE